MAGRLAESLGGELEQQPQTVRIAGLRGRRYEIGYEREGVDLRQRLTLLLSRRTEYQLLCRWEAAAEMPGACSGPRSELQNSSLTTGARGVSVPRTQRQPRGYGNAAAAFGEDFVAAWNSAAAREAARPDKSRSNAFAGLR